MKVIESVLLKVTLKAGEQVWKAGEYKAPLPSDFDSIVRMEEKHKTGTVVIKWGTTTPVIGTTETSHHFVSPLGNVDFTPPEPTRTTKVAKLESKTIFKGDPELANISIKALREKEPPKIEVPVLAIPKKVVPALKIRSKKG